MSLHQHEGMKPQGEMARHVQDVFELVKIGAYTKLNDYPMVKDNLEVEIFLQRDMDALIVNMCSFVAAGQKHMTKEKSELVPINWWNHFKSDLHHWLCHHGVPFCVTDWLAERIHWRHITVRYLE